MTVYNLKSCRLSLLDYLNHMNRMIGFIWYEIQYMFNINNIWIIHYINYNIDHNSWSLWRSKSPRNCKVVGDRIVMLVIFHNGIYFSRCPTVTLKKDHQHLKPVTNINICRQHWCTPFPYLNLKLNFSLLNTCSVWIGL